MTTLKDKTTQEVVNGVQFLYTKDGMNDIVNAVGEDNVTFSKARHPSSVAVAVIKKQIGTITLFETDWLIVSNNGLCSYNDATKAQLFDKVRVNAVQDVVVESDESHLGHDLLTSVFGDNYKQYDGNASSADSSITLDDIAILDGHVDGPEAVVEEVVVKPTKAKKRWFKKEE